MRHRRLRTSTAIATAVLVPLLGLSACGSDDDSDSDDNNTETTSEATPEEPDAEPTEDEASEEEADEPAEASGDKPDWALDVTTPGELITTVEAGDITVEVYQVGTTQAVKDGMFVDPDTNEPILKEGDEIVFVNYVITNTGAPVDLGSSKVQVSARYANWQWAQGMDGQSDSALWEEQGVNPDRLAPGALNDEGIYTLGTSQTYSYGDNFAYQQGGEITFQVRYTPVDDQGDLIHDQRVEAEGTTTIN